ncbi:hypothetical protein [Marinobacter sp. LN3S78]|uniref:hypothetical protein n=1 Tax=Marinobacter sp. LN3S78 TaxID=3382300 RepID=UPI00387ACFD4
MTRSGPTIVLVCAMTVVTGCANRDASLSQGVDDPCATVQGLIAEYPEGFPSYRGKANNTRNITTYRAKKDLVAGHCEIWQWGNGDTAYSCSAAAPSIDIARDRYLKSVNYLMQCLGPDWSTVEMTRDRDGETDGQLTRFTSGEHPDLSVSVHLIDEKRGPKHSYTNYLYLGTDAQDPGATD